MDFVTVATFDTPPRAHLAIGMLSEAGIDAVLRNEHIVAGAWDIGQASGGVEVRVQRADADRAHAMVEQAAFHGGVTDVEEFSEFDDEDGFGDEATTTPEQRADREIADRALRSAMFGFFFAPLQVYSLWLLLRLSARLSDDRATPEIRRRMRSAFLMDLFVIVLGVLTAAAIAR